jgi:hypothetical protein
MPGAREHLPGLMAQQDEGIGVLVLIGGEDQEAGTQVAHPPRSTSTADPLRRSSRPPTRRSPLAICRPTPFWCRIRARKPERGPRSLGWSHHERPARAVVSRWSPGQNPMWPGPEPRPPRRKHPRPAGSPGNIARAAATPNSCAADRRPGPRPGPGGEVGTESAPCSTVSIDGPQDRVPSVNGLGADVAPGRGGDPPGL